MRGSYRLLCPIARALDRLGDRWTLLILRDLHAGPMRFTDIQEGLPGLASNLLTTRLDKLQEAGLVARQAQHYALTPQGRRTDEVLWSLARLGMQFAPDPDLKRPGHLRLAAVTLQNALRRVAPPDRALTVELVLDGESFDLRYGDDTAWTVRYGAPDSPDVVVRTAYEPLMAAAGGELPLESFEAEHVRLEGAPAAVGVFAAVMLRVMTEAFRAAPPAA